MTDVDAALAGFAGLDEAALGRPWSWRGRTMHVREALYRTLEEGQVASVRAAVGPHAESRRTLALAQRAFGDLGGLLIGLPESLLDRAPRPGEWTVRETLRHVLLVERRYAVQTLHAVARADAEPVRLADDRLPAAAPADGEGDVAALLARIGQARAETNARLAAVPEAAMTRPTVWAQHEVDVRFRLHRFAAHLVEHTIQVEKALDALGWRQSEGRRLVRRIAAGLGELDGLGAAAEAHDLRAGLVERFASVTAALRG